MTTRKGCTRPLNPLTELVEEAVELCASYGQTDITPGEIAELARVSSKKAAEVLRRKAKVGCFVQIRFGVYRRVSGVKIAKRLPISFVAEKAWTVLDKNRHRQMALADITGEVETLAGRKNLTLAKQVGVLLSKWSKSGYLERSGEKGRYSYRILPGIASRPPVEK